jgi:hypothetical protein
LLFCAPPRYRAVTVPLTWERPAEDEAALFPAHAVGALYHLVLLAAGVTVRLWSFWTLGHYFTFTLLSPLAVPGT